MDRDLSSLHNNVFHKVVFKSVLSNLLGEKKS